MNLFVFVGLFGYPMTFSSHFYNYDALSVGELSRSITVYFQIPTLFSPGNFWTEWNSFCGWLEKSKSDKMEDEQKQKQI